MLERTLNFYSFEQLTPYSFADLVGIKFFGIEITVTPTKSVIGADPSNNACGVKFTSTSRIDGWECRGTKVGEPSGIGAGLLVREGESVRLGAETVFDVMNTDLTLGDGLYKITVYVRLNDIWYGGEG
jgi:hypothetical protein